MVWGMCRLKTCTHLNLHQLSFLWAGGDGAAGSFAC